MVNSGNNNRCPNCQIELLPFIDPSWGMDFQYYCPDFECGYSTDSDSLVYQRAYNDFKWNDVNIEGWKFYRNELSEYYKQDNTNIHSNKLLTERIKGRKIDEKVKIPDYFDLPLSSVVGYEDIKYIIRIFINTSNPKKRPHLLISGYQGTSKTVFLQSIIEDMSQYIKCVYIDCTTLTKSGVLDLILDKYESGEKIDLLLLDEIDKVDENSQSAFLNMLQTGELQVNTKFEKRRAVVKSMQVIASANYLNKLIAPLFDRFTIIYIPRYTKEKFLFIAEKVVGKKYGFDDKVCKYISESIYDKVNPPSMRRVDDVANCMLQYKNKKTSEQIMNEIDKFLAVLEEWKVPREYLPKSQK